MASLESVLPKSPRETSAAFAKPHRLVEVTGGRLA
jgi:hypothetical protein